MIDIRVLNKEFQLEGVIDRYKSLIWTDRYNRCGDFEILAPITPEIMRLAQHDFYLDIDESDKNMIIESLTISYDPDDGPMLLISGRSLESILDRRFNRKNNDTYKNSTRRNIIRNLLRTNILPDETYNTIAPRRISNMIYLESTDPNIVNPKTNGQFDMLQLDEAIELLCDEDDWGYKITLNNKNQFVFELYIGSDRSYNQIENPVIIFSPTFGNLNSSEFLYSKASYKNVAYCRNITSYNTMSTGVYVSQNIKRAIEVYADDRTTNDYIGLDRRELYVDGDGIGSTGNIASNTSTDWANFDAALRGEAAMQLGRHKITEVFTGEGENTPQYVYRKDYFLGDIVQLEDIYGNAGPARISEFIISVSDSEGLKMYPTFAAVK